MKELLEQLNKRKYINIDCRTKDGTSFDLYFDVPKKGSFRLKFNSNVDIKSILTALGDTILWHDRFNFYYKPYNTTKTMGKFPKTNNDDDDDELDEDEDY